MMMMMMMMKAQKVLGNACWDRPVLLCRRWQAVGVELVYIQRRTHTTVVSAVWGLWLFGGCSRAFHDMHQGWTQLHMMGHLRLRCFIVEQALNNHTVELDIYTLGFQFTNITFAAATTKTC